ncbi:type II toxin-antitoxin system RelE/ParE family toxin [Lentisalinibacter sediminis]|uniref:type II toxin-antitoxin system RelE/ParE family toxin n=1 Tax=Lentisalinibacter sediminis TaxID=2992237 RepID=UPI0038662AF2
MRPLELRPEAAADIEQAALWYEEKRTGCGSEFLSAVSEALELIQDHPEGFPRVYRGLRRVLLRRFPYGIYYRSSSVGTVVLACMHGRRAPRRWMTRLLAR